MSSRPARVLMILLLAGLVTSSLADKALHPADRKFFGRVVPPQESSHPYQPSLDAVYYSTDVPQDIPDGPNGVANSTLDIPDDVTITDVNVMVTITHPWIRDLTIHLFSPSGDSVLLMTLFPGDYDSNLTQTWFDDEAFVSIDSGAPPFTGRYRPLDSLAAFDGLNAQGTWTLRVIDEFHLDTGRVESWAIEINRIRTLTGTVRDRQTQEPLALVHVIALPESQNVVTDALGRYGFDFLAPGPHNLQFAKACYDSLVVEGVVTGDTSETVLDTSLTAGPPDTVNFVSLEPPVLIPDASPAGANMPLVVNSNRLICDLDVTVNITHTFTGDLDLWLISPAHDTVQLIFVGDSCYNRGANLTECRFDDEAVNPFPQGNDPGGAPFTGRWRPYGSLARLDGKSTQGTWELRARDYCEGDVGAIDSFSLNVSAPSSLAADVPVPPLPQSFVFEGNFPNPFNAVTEFRFSLARESFVELVLFDITGRRTATVLNGMLGAGEHSIPFDASALPSGIYLARLSAFHQSQAHKLILLK